MFSPFFPNQIPNRTWIQRIGRIDQGSRTIVTTVLSVLQRNEWNGIVTIEVAEVGKAAAGATAVVRCGAIQPYRVKDPGQSEPEHRLKPEVTASP